MLKKAQIAGMLATILTSLFLGIPNETTVAYAQGVVQQGGYGTEGYDPNAVLPTQINWDGQSKFKAPQKVQSLWSVKIPGTTVSQVIGSDGTIYLATGDFLLNENKEGAIYAVSKEGKVKWKYHLGTYMYPPGLTLAKDGRLLVFLSLDRTGLLVLNPDGTVKSDADLRYQLSDPITGAIPAISPDGDVYIMTRNQLVNLDSSGAVKEKIALRGRADSPVIGKDGTIYAVAFDALYAFDKNHKLKWKIPKSYFYAPTIAKDGTLYLLNDGYFPELSAIDPTGKQKWKVTLEGQTASVPSIGADGTVYVGTDFQFYAISPSGKVQWKIPFGPLSHNSKPILAKDGTILTAFHHGQDTAVLSIDRNGKQKWRYMSKGRSYSLLLGADGLVYTITKDSNGTTITAIGEKTTSPAAPQIK